MYFFLQLRVCICMYIFSVDSLKFVIKEFSGQPTPRGGGGYSQMGYIMCRFIGYGVQAAKSGTGYRNQRETLG